MEAYMHICLYFGIYAYVHAYMLAYMEAYLHVCWHICIAENIYVAQANAKRASAMSADENEMRLFGLAM